MFSSCFAYFSEGTGTSFLEFMHLLLFGLGPLEWEPTSLPDSGGEVPQIAWFPFGLP